VKKHDVSIMNYEYQSWTMWSSTSYFGRRSLST